MYIIYVHRSLCAGYFIKSKNLSACESADDFYLELGRGEDAAEITRKQFIYVKNYIIFFFFIKLENIYQKAFIIEFAIFVQLHTWRKSFVIIRSAWFDHDSMFMMIIVFFFSILRHVLFKIQVLKCLYSRWNSKERHEPFQEKQQNSYQLLAKFSDILLSLLIQLVVARSLLLWFSRWGGFSKCTYYYCCEFIILSHRGKTPSCVICTCQCVLGASSVI